MKAQVENAKQIMIELSQDDMAKIMNGHTLYSNLDYEETIIIRLSKDKETKACI